MILHLDFETFFDKGYSLREMTVPEYILDDRFEMILCAVAVDNEPTMVLSEPELRKFLQSVDPEHATVVSHNMLFDGCILAWRMGFVPHRMLCTLSMARCILGHVLRNLDLHTVSTALGLGAKGDTVHKVKGLHKDDIIAAGLMDDFVEYCRNDNDLCREIFKKLAPAFPPAQWRMLDLVMRCAVEPRLTIDRPRLQAHLETVRAEKARLLTACGVDKGTLLSAAKFQQELEKRDIKVEMKPGKLGDIPAVAKTDPFMVSLQEHPDAEIQALAAARLGLRSTLEESRAEKLLAISALPWAQPGSLPVPLRYAGARTHRLAGGDKINLQNLSRVTTGGSQLRNCITAPPGCSIVVCDLAQIEARLVAWQAGASTLVAQFANKLDPYSRLAENIFRYRIDPKIHRAERHVGKAAVLSCGYGIGVDNFYTKTLQLARSQRVDIGKLFTKEVAERAVKTYRADNKEIPQLWYNLNTILQTAFVGKSAARQVGPVEIGKGYICLPDGLSLQYDDPQCTDGDVTYRHPVYGTRQRIYGAHALENLTQALAGQLIRDAWLRIDKLGIRIVLSVHDEVIAVVPDTELQTAKEIIHTEMVRVPEWASGLPLAADIGSGRDYGSCK